ncbi:hypothetical protein D3C73_1570600 [compost metagenome]
MHQLAVHFLPIRVYAKGCGDVPVDGILAHRQRDDIFLLFDRFQHGVQLVSIRWDGQP